MKKKCIIYYHGNDWHDIPSRQHYLMKALSKHIPVIYLDGGRDKKLKVTFTHPMENVTLIRGLTSLMNSLQRRRLNLLTHLLVWRHLRWVRRKYEQIIFWDAENLLRPYRFIPHNVLIFECMDPCFSNNPQDALEHNKRELGILKSADKVFATSDILAKKCSRHHNNVTLINNACEPSEYKRTLLTAASRPSWWPETNKPIAAYFGTIDWRFDFTYALKAARDNPSIYFIFAGKILQEFQSSVAELEALPNVICPGKILISDERRYLLSHCSVYLIPFTPGDTNDALNTIKMYEYALFGKPIVGTAIHELIMRPDIVFTADTPEKFSKLIPNALKMSRDPKIKTRLRIFALENTWTHRARQAWEEIIHL